MKMFPGIRAWLKISIKNKLISVIFIFLSVPLLLFTVFFFASQISAASKDYSYRAKENLDKCTELVNRELLNYTLKSSYITTEKSLFLRTGIQYESLVDKVIFYNEVNKYLNNIQLLDSNWKDIFTIYITNRSLYENRYFKFLDNSTNKAFINDNVINMKTNSVIWYPMIKTGNDGKRYIYLYRNLIPNSSSTAVLETRILFSDLEFLIDNMSFEQGSYILYENELGQGEYLGMAKSIDNENSQIIDYRNSNKFIILENKLVNGHSLVAAVSKSEIMSGAYKSLGILMGVIFSIIFCIMMASSYTIRKITNDLNVFIHSIADEPVVLFDENGEADHANDEVSLLKKRFRSLINTIQTLNSENVEYIKKASKLEMELLQSKINPHLLYNSMSVMKWMAQRNLDTRSVGFIDSLTKYYRMSLNRGNNILSLREELEMIREYVKINCFSRKSDFILDIEVDESIMGIHTLKHILQPIVENSIMHGLIGREGDKKIKITGVMKENAVLLCVEDNGYGMHEETIDKLLSRQYESEIGGYGIRNLLDRIKTYYGPEYGLTIESVRDAYTRVCLTIPVLERQELVDRINIG